MKFMNYAKNASLIIATAWTCLGPPAWLYYAVLANVGAGFGGQNTFKQNTALLIATLILSWSVFGVLYHYDKKFKQHSN